MKFLIVKKLLFLFSCIALSACGNGPSSNDQLVKFGDNDNIEFNCTKQRVRIFKNNDIGIKEGWYSLPELRKAMVAESMSPFIVEFGIKDLRENADLYCDD